MIAGDYLGLVNRVGELETEVEKIRKAVAIFGEEFIEMIDHQLEFEKKTKEILGGLRDLVASQKAYIETLT